MFPKELRVVAWIQLVGGLLSLAGMVYEVTQNRFLLDFGILSVVAFDGLLRRSAGWRTYTLAVLWLEMFLAPIAFFARLSPRWHDHHRIVGIPWGNFVSVPWLSVLTVASFLLAIWQYRVLTRAEIKSLFSRPTLARAH